MQNKKIVVISDSFKGTISSLRICELFDNELKNRDDIEPTYIPIADGGEGSLDCISRVLNGCFKNVKVRNLYNKKIKTRFFIDYDNNAYIEAASCVGLSLAKKNNNPGLVTTYGLGEQTKEAILQGCSHIYVFLGGSASNDGGVGLAAALGYKFFNNKNKLFLPTGLTLKDITRINLGTSQDILGIVPITVLSDVRSPFCGPEGAAYKFAPQKGAKEEEVELLDAGLKHLSALIERDLGIDVSNIPGAGAAGGLGGGLVGFASASISSGIDTILNLIDFDKVISDVDLVISGEGKLDEQTLDGKVIDGVAKHCLKMHKPLDLIVGISELSESEVKKMYPCLNHLYETNDKHLPFEEVKDNAEIDYIRKIKELLNE